MEQEGRAVDVRTYITLHAERFCSREEISNDAPDFLRDKFDSVPAGTAFRIPHQSWPLTQILWFKDREGGVKTVVVYLDKIQAIMAKPSDRERYDIFQDQLDALNFRFTNSRELSDVIAFINDDRKRRSQEEKETAQFEF